MNGYKVLRKGLINNYGFVYELGKKYYLNGKLDNHKNGFYFCENIEDTFRYVDCFVYEVEVVEVEASGEILTTFDDYNEYYGIHASTIIELLRIIPREEIFQMVIDSHAPYRVKRLASTLKLTKEEVEILRRLYPSEESTYNYYQNEDYYKKRLLKK